MSENKIGVALVHEICPICGKSMNEQILMNSVLSKKYAKEIENVHGKAIGYSKTACEDCSKNYYITTLVHDCLLSDLTNVFDYNLLKYIKKPNFTTNTINYIISANIDIVDEVEEQIQRLLQYDNYKDIYYIRNNNEFNFYLKTYSND